MTEQAARPDHGILASTLNRMYNLDIREIHLHREMIGQVFFVTSDARRLVFKLHRSFNREQALQSIDIIQYLQRNEYPVPSIIPTTGGSPYIEVAAPEGECVGLLYEYVEGAQPDLKTEITQVGEQTAELHRLMDSYDKPLIRRGKGFYIDRYISDLRKLEYPPERVRALEDYGVELWNRMESLPDGFCHGDLHSGNMFRTGSGRYVLIDFDIASRTRCVIDVATLTNMSDFNRLEESAYDTTMKMLERFYDGYSRVRPLSRAEIDAVFDFVAIRHYELIATITECRGLDDLSRRFLDQQYDWLLRWRDICGRKRS